MKQRTLSWQNTVATALEQHSKQIKNLYNYINSDQFKTLLFKASITAIQTHQQEKISALKNILLNSAIYTEIQEDLKLSFIRFIEELTPSHLSLLKFIHDNEESICNLKNYNDLLNQYNSYTVKLNPDEFAMLFQELTQKNLIKVSSSMNSFEDVHESVSLIAESGSGENDLPMLKMSGIGSCFIKFIMDPNYQR